MKTSKKYIRDKRSPLPKTENVSKVMSRNRAKNTGPEKLLREAMRAHGMTGYRLYPKQVLGKPDICFLTRKLAIFVNGCFWHSCPKCKSYTPKHNTDFWINKFKANKERDTRKTISLELIAKKLGVDLSDAKNHSDILSRAILGVKARKIAEFEKADVQMKTIKLERSGALKESMSFKQINFKDIVNEEWEESYWHETLTKRFFFIVFQHTDAGLVLKIVKFWAMPASDLELAKQFWLDTQNKIREDDYENFIKISDDRICHVRPKGKNSYDLMETPSGRMEKKKSYWLNAAYIKSILHEA